MNDVGKVADVAKIADVGKVADVANTATTAGRLGGLAEDAGAAGRVAARGEDVAASTIARGEPHATASVSNASVGQGTSPDASFEAFQKMLHEEGVVGNVEPAGDLVKLGPHGRASANRAELGVSGADVQSAHVAPRLHEASAQLQSRSRFDAADAENKPHRNGPPVEA
jgi:hypothetical protein